MDYDVVEAQHTRGHAVWLRFRDGSAGEVDLAQDLRGPVFEPLHDVAYFRVFTVHPAFCTLVWLNGADFAPEFLYEKVRIAA